MNINPEFRRNLWLELTPSRLVGMPLVLGLLFFLAYLLDDKQYGENVATTALLLFGLLACLWGTRLASESLITEIREHTWDGQRMSVIGPWSMTWGKLLGSTAYPWYGSLLCMLVYLTSRPALGLSLPGTVVLLLGSGLLGQAVGLLSSLQATRKNQRYGRFQTTVFLVLGAGCSVTLLSWPFADSTQILWYGRSYPDGSFVLSSMLLFLIWAMFGIYRLLRVELQLRSRPWAWCMFVLFMIIYLAGFLEEGGWLAGYSLLQERLLLAFSVSVVMVYGMIFSENKNPIVFRRLLKHLGRGEWAQVTEAFPLWLTTLPFVILTGLLLVGAELSSAPSGPHLKFSVSVVATAFFLLRDIGIVLYLNLGRIPKRADMLTMLLLFLLYGAVPLTLPGLNLDLLAGMFWPLQGMPAEIILPASAGQALFLLVLLVRRWRNNHSPGI